MPALPPSVKRLLVIGPLLLFVGVVTSLGEESSLTGYFAAGGFFLTALGLHRLGRSGTSLRSS